MKVAVDSEMTVEEMKEQGITHLGGDLYGKYDGWKYVDIYSIGGKRIMFASKGILEKALELCKDSRHG